MNTDTRIRVSIDPRRDLREGGHDVETAEDFAAAYRGAFGWLAEQLGLTDAEVFETTYGSDRERARRTSTPLPFPADDDETVERTMWQAAHDLCWHDGTEWQWRESTGMVARLARAFRIEARTPVTEALS